MSNIVAESLKMQKTGESALKSFVVSELKICLETLPVTLFRRFRKIRNSISDGPLLTANIALIAFFGIFCIFGSMLTEPQEILKGELWIWPTILFNSIIYVVAARRVVRNLDRFCLNKIDDASLNEFLYIIQDNYSLKKRISFNLIFGTILTTFLCSSFYLATSKVTIVSYIAAFLVTQFIAPWIQGAYIVYIFTNFLRKQSDKLALFPLDPSNSVIIKKAEDTVRIVGFAIAAILALFIPGPIVINGPNLFYLYIGVGILVGTSFSILIMFIISNYQLSEVVHDQKIIIISYIQKEIQQTLKMDTLDQKEAKERLDYLISLHEKILQSSDMNILIKSISQTSSTLIIPLASFIISNYSTISGIVQNII